MRRRRESFRLSTLIIIMVCLLGSTAAIEVGGMVHGVASQNVQRATELGPRQLLVTISTDTHNRNGWTAISQGADIRKFMLNPVVLWAHKYDQEPIGRVLSIRIVTKRIYAVVEFADTPRGRAIYELYRTGQLSAWSIGLRPIETEVLGAGNGWNPDLLFRKWELLELSAVPVPANPDALTHR